MSRRWWTWPALALALALACGPRQVAVDDDASGSASESSASGSSSDSTSSSSSSDSSSSSSSSDSSSSDETASESSPPTDLPNDLPEGCTPLEFLDADYRPTGVWSGWVHCQDSEFRLAAIDCPLAFEYEACDPTNCDACVDGEQCLDYYTNDSGYCFCGRNCTSDADCGNNEICACRSGTGEAWLTSGKNQCILANCDDESDCPAIPDLEVPHCRLSRDLCGGPESVHCRTELDACTFDADCGNQYCHYDGIDERWTCTDSAICE